MLKIIQATGIQYEGETYEDMCRRDDAVAEHNRRVDEELAKWRPAPAKFYEAWMRRMGYTLEDWKGK